VVGIVPAAFAVTLYDVGVPGIESVADVAVTDVTDTPAPWVNFEKYEFAAL